MSAFNERVRLFLQRGQMSGLFLELENERWEAQNLLDYWSNELYHLVQEDINATLAEFDATLAPELDDSLCPYIGLDPFDAEDQNLFFGREPMIKNMVERLQAQSFLAVSGPSGSGKTSLVLAGLLPILKAGGLTDSENWLYLPPIMPGSDPIAGLVHLLRTADNSLDWAAETSRQLLLAPETLLTLVERRAMGKTAVLVIDQFEELFTLCQDQPARQGFIDNLLHLIQAKNSKHIVVLTMRTDLENNLLRMAEFQTAYAAAQLRVTTMSAPELRQAIQQPADLVGLKFEEGVIEQLVSDVLGEPAALPLLQFTLLKLWQKRERNRVTWEAYKTLGSGRDALANVADRLYSNLNPAEQRVARRMLLKMVRPTQGLDVVRNRVVRQQLYDLNVGQPRVDYVVNHFVRERLLRITAGETPGKDQLEIAHEALVRNWPRLIGWLEDERASLRHRLRLTETAEQWDLLGRDESALLRGLVLDEAQQYTDLSELEKLFVEASVTAVKREEIEREAARQRELEQTRQFARRLSILVVALAIIILISFGLALLARYNAVAAEESAVVAENARSTAVANESAAENARSTAESNAQLAALNASTAEAAQVEAETSANLAATAESEANIQRDIAEAERILAEENALAAENARATAVANEDLAQTNARLATARELAAASLAQLTSDPQLSLLLALEAVNATLVAGEHPPAEATDALYRSVRASQQLFTLAGHTGPIYDTAVSADGRWIATASDDNSVKIWNASTGQQVHTLTGHNAPITAVAFSPTNQHLASVSNNSLLIVWDIESGNLVRVMSGEDDGGARTVAFHPDGERIAVGYDVGTARVWNFTTGNSLLRQFNHNQPVNDVEFTPDGIYLITASQDGNILIQNATTGIPLNSFAAELDAAGRVIGVNDVALSLDGTRLAAAKSNGIVRVWENDQLIATLSGHSGAVTAVAFSADGLQLATAGADSSAKVWDIANERPTLTLSGHNSDLTGIAFYPTDERLVTAGIDNTARVWNATSGLEPLVLTDHRGGINGAQYSADGSQIATASSDNTVRIWDSETGEVIGRLLAFSNPVNMAVFHPTEPLMATASEDTVVRLFDLTTSQVIEPLYFHPEVVNDVAFNVDGSLLATAGGDGIVRLWDTAVHEPITLLSHDSAVNTVAFSSDGSLLVATSNDTAVVWDVATGEVMHHIAGHTGLIHHAVFSPDGQYVATAGADGLVKLWQLSTGNAIRTFSGHGGPVLWVTFDAAGTQLATAGVDRTARLWDVETGTLLRTVVGHTSAVTMVAFNLTGDNLVSASLDGTTRVTPFTTINDLLTHAWGRLARPLTPAQCSQYLRGLPCITSDLNATPPTLMP